MIVFSLGCIGQASLGSHGSSEITQTELEVEPHDDDDVYHGQHEHGEEEVATEDEFVDVETHGESNDGEKGDHVEVNPADEMDTQLLDETLLHEDQLFASDGEEKGARKVGVGHHL